MKTTKRLYFTCPIKALYIIKEFGVQFYIEGKQLSSCNLSTGEVDKNEKTIRIDFEEEYLDQILGSFAQIKDLESKIYVAPKSESIFEPQEGDLDAEGFCFTKGAAVENHMTGKIDYYTDACWLVKIEEFTRSKEKSKTIFRDNKQFFMPEVENEN